MLAKQLLDEKCGKIQIPIRFYYILFIVQLPPEKTGRAVQIDIGPILVTVKLSMIDDTLYLY